MVCKNDVKNIVDKEENTPGSLIMTSTEVSPIKPLATGNYIFKDISVRNTTRNGTYGINLLNGREERQRKTT